METGEFVVAGDHLHFGDGALWVDLEAFMEFIELVVAGVRFRSEGFLLSCGVEVRGKVLYFLL